MNEIKSPGKFENKFPVASIGYRILAFLIDFAIFWIIMMVVGMFFGTPHEEGIGYSLNGFPAFLMMLLGLFLWPISEGVFGQTIGKRLLNIKVVNGNLKPIGIGQAFVRFFLAFIDYMFLIGLIIAATNKQNKRIGDLVANTIVIKTKNANIQQRV
ncbi:RDD family protein [Psychroserpens ponticola]|uniref:RDD family protein n=1 Tax=Psychroserpens ponticola TaxID=2932268 RepID=A0ABY7RSZ1_9FLAO|nr:RDD family protein [Psychroserpens ponticola]WCO00233.1 RDD family protein [Psychroserpens ponticola]